MTTIRRGIVLAVLGVLATAAETRADSPGELAERLRKATAVLSEMASGKQDTDIPREKGPKSLHDAANTDGSYKGRDLLPRPVHRLLRGRLVRGRHRAAGRLRDPDALRRERRLPRGAAGRPPRDPGQRAPLRQRARHLLATAQEALRAIR